MKELYQNTWCSLDRGVRIFLLTGKERALVIDTGMSGQDIRQMVAGHTDLPYMLLCTHADNDHISGNGQFDEFYMHPSEAWFYRNMQKGAGRMVPVFDGDLIDLGGRMLETVHLPGHTPGSITVLDRQNRCLIGGDPIQENGEIFMFGPHRSMDAYIASLKLLTKRDDFDSIYPSHAKENVSREIIPLLIDGAEKILAGGIEPAKRELFGKTVGCYDVGVSRFLCELPV